MMIVDVVIPAYNEEGCIGKVIADIDKKIVRHVVVVDNNSKDRTKEVAESFGAIVLHEKQMGYGYACLNGMDYLSKLKQQPDILVFLDGDYSDYPEEIAYLIEPILTDKADFVIGNRNNEWREKGSMTPQQVFGNWLATFLIQLFYRVQYHDLGPFRAIRFAELLALNMQDKTYGWTVEMQLKAIKNNLTTIELPVKYRKRGAGKSKVAGTLKGTILAGYKIISTIIKYR